jgi:hypothetical protein
MCKCKKCGENYEIPKDSININYINFCLKCQINFQRKLIKRPLEVIIKANAKQVGL